MADFSSSEADASFFPSRNGSYKIDFTNSSIWQIQGQAKYYVGGTLTIIVFWLTFMCMMYACVVSCMEKRRIWSNRNMEAKQRADALSGNIRARTATTKV